MDRHRLSPKLLIGLLIAAFFVIALSIRVFLPYYQIFVGEWVKFSSNDAYYHMRLVDNLVHNFPRITEFDHFFIYPGGIVFHGAYFFNRLLAGIIWIIGLGSPTQHTIDVIGAYFPAVLAALTVIPVYFIGKALFNRWAGVFAAALLAVLPGEYLGRSILGFTDNHVAETLFSTVALLFLILAVKSGGEQQVSFNHLIQRDWRATGRLLLYSLLSGIFMGIYLDTWRGGLLFVFIVALYLVVQFVLDHLRHKSTDHLTIASFILFLVVMVTVLPFSPGGDTSISLVVVLLLAPVLSAVSWLMSRRGWKPFYYPLVLLVLAGLLVGIMRLLVPDTLDVLLHEFGFVFFPTGSTATTTLEMQPFLSPQGSFDTAVAWGNFTTSFFLFTGWPIPGFAFISFAILIWLFIRRGGDEKHWLLFFLWTLVILVATLVQRRFAYYLVVNIALLSAYLSWQAIWLAGLRKLSTMREAPDVVKPESARAQKPKKHAGRQGITIYHVNTVLAIIVVFVLVFSFNIIKAKEVASQARFAPSDAWQASLLWMKDNTPEPLGDPDAYYKFYEMPPSLENYKYPETAYGVTAWWDYGYWISRTAHRLPTTNPSQAPEPIRKVAGLFLSQNESTASEITKELESSYIIADYAIVTSKFWAVVDWAKQEQDEFIGTYYVIYEGKLMQVQLFRPEYYYATIVRLYNFNGKAVSDGKPMVVTYDEKVDRDGNHYKQIIDAKEFSSYQEALDYVASQSSGNYDIVSKNPFISPIPLPAMEDYKLIYSSEIGISYPDVGTIPEIKIFEYIGD